jgi:hypothetical protein
MKNHLPSAAIPWPEQKNLIPHFPHMPKMSPCQGFMPVFSSAMMWRQVKGWEGNWPDTFSPIISGTFNLRFA